jgi:hypothetical protein
MQMSRRFAEYGLTGGFFWVFQLTIFWIGGEYRGAIISLLNSLPAAEFPNHSLLDPLVVGLSGAVAIIVIFVTGLLLDLVASYFKNFELNVFVRQCSKHAAWLKHLIDENDVFVGDEYRYLAARFPGHSVLHFLIRPIAIWRREWWSELIRLPDFRNLWTNAEKYERLWSFLYSYVMIRSRNAELNLLTDQFALWRAARAIGVSMIISVGMWLVVTMSGEINMGPIHHDPAYNGINLLITVGLFLPLIVSMIITYSTFSRYCGTLFALTYVIHAEFDAERPLN